MKKLFGLMVVFVALVMSGCGGEKKPAAPPAETTPPPADQPADDATPAQPPANP